MSIFLGYLFQRSNIAIILKKNIFTSVECFKTRRGIKQNLDREFKLYKTLTVPG